MAVGLANLSGDGLTAAVSALRKAHVDYVRMDFAWPDMEGTQGVFNTASWDAAADACKAAGIQIIGIIDYCPPWANGGDKFAPPTNMADYAAFCAFLAQRYAPKGVRHWEIWNEQNGSTFWHPAPDPVLYTKMLAAAYPAIKAVDPKATVILGGMATFGTDGVNYNARDFLTAVYAAGGGPFFDGVGFHPYCYPDVPGTVNGDNWTQMYETTPSLRSIMEANGDGAKKIWATEFGCPTQPNTVETEAFQAQYLKAAYGLAKTFDWLAVLCWYTYQDNIPEDPNDPQSWFGLIRADGSAKPAMAEYEA